MTVPFRTFALFGLALGMLAAGYLVAPAPGASRTVPPQPVAKAEPPAPPKPGTTLVASRPPVPLVTAPRTSYFRTAERTTGSPGSSDKPTAEMATSTTNPPDPNDTTQALAIQQASATTGPGGDDAEAKRAIEFDGYRNVRSLVKGPDGNWHGRAMRGRTEIAVRVDASGSVSAE
jgi:outer membrane biosynthesis protein TonB